MALFSLEQKIPSCNVSKDFIKQIEEYLLKEVPELVQLPPDSFKDKYYVSLGDKYGTETLTSISEYRPATFADSIEYLTLSTGAATPLEVKIRFTTEPRRSRIEISYQAPQAREVVMGVYEGLRKLLEPHRNMHFFFHPNMIIQPFLVILLFASTVFPVGFWKESWSTLCAGVALLIVTYSVAHWFKPYVAFETRVNRIKAKWADWFVGGLATFIVFGTILTLVRKKIVGM
jgi:hypothetical protein